MDKKEPVENVLSAQILVLTQMIEMDRRMQKQTGHGLEEEVMKEVKESRRRLIERLLSEQ